MEVDEWLVDQYATRISTTIFRKESVRPVSLDAANARLILTVAPNNEDQVESWIFTLPTCSTMTSCRDVPPTVVARLTTAADLRIVAVDLTTNLIHLPDGRIIAHVLVSQDSSSPSSISWFRFPVGHNCDL